MQIFKFDEKELLVTKGPGRPSGGGIRELMLQLKEGEGMELPAKSRQYVTVQMRDLRVTEAYFTTKKHDTKDDTFNLYRISKQTYEALNKKKKLN